MTGGKKNRGVGRYEGHDARGGWTLRSRDADHVHCCDLEDGLAVRELSFFKGVSKAANKETLFPVPGMASGFGGAQEGFCAALVCLYIARHHANATTPLKEGAELFADMQKSGFKGATGVLKTASDDLDDPLLQRHGRVAAFQNRFGKFVTFSDESDRGAKNIDAANGVLANCSNFPMKGKGELTRAAFDEATRDPGNSFWYISEEGHAWGLVSIKDKGKFKLLDPNWGILRFDSEEKLYEQALVYKEYKALYLRVS